MDGSQGHVAPAPPPPPQALQAFAEKLQQSSTLVRDQQMMTELTRVLQQYWMNRRNVTQQFALEAARLLKCEPNLVRQLRDVIEQSEDIELTLAGEPQREEGSEAELVVYTSGDSGEILNLTTTASEFSINTNAELRKAILTPDRGSERILKPPSASWASCVMELLQLEMKLSDSLHKQGAVGANYGKLCLHYLRYLAREYNALPPSFILHDITVEGNHPLWGGGFSDIYKGTLNEKHVCVKVLRVFLSTYDREKLFREFSREALVWKQLRHPNVLPFLGVSWTLFRPSFCLISPWMTNGSIQSYIEAHPDFDRWQAISEVADAMRYLHEYTPNIVHCDIRTSNILISDDGHCLLADFGLVSFSETQGISTKSNNTHGSTRWMAPELLDPATSQQCHKAPATPRDIYAFGCTILEIFSGRIPFHHLPQDASVVCEVLAGRRPPTDKIPNNLSQLVEECWTHDPAERPSVRQILTRLQEISSDREEREAFDPNLLVRPSPTPSADSSPSSSVESLPPLPVFPSRASTNQHSLSGSERIGRYDSVASHSSSLQAGTSLQRAFSPPIVEVSKPYEMPIQSDFPESPPPDYLSTITSFSPSPLLVPSPWGFELSSPLGSALSSLSQPSYIPPSLTPPSAFVPQPPFNPPLPDTDPFPWTHISSGDYPPEKGRNPRLQVNETTANPPHQDRPTIVIPPTIIEPLPSEKLSAISTPRPLPSPGSSSSRESHVMSPVRRVDDILGKTVLLRKLESQSRKNYDPVVIDECLNELLFAISEDPDNASRLVSTGTLPVLCQLLRLMFSMGKDLRLTMLAIGSFLIDESCSQIIADQNVIDIFISPLSSVTLNLLPVSLWCLARSCRTAQFATRLMNRGVTQLLIDNCFTEDDETVSRAAILIGALAVTSAEAERLGRTSVIQALWDFIRNSYPSPTYIQSIRSVTYAFARLSQSPKSALLIARVGFLRSLVNYLLASEDLEILNWSARLVGLMLRHNSNEITNRLIDAGVPTALIRIPFLITTANLASATDLISSYAFALRSLRRVLLREEVKSTYKEEAVSGTLIDLLSMVSKTPPHATAQLELLKTLCHIWDAWGSSARKQLRESCLETVLRLVWSRATLNEDLWKQCQLLQKKLSSSPRSPTLSPLLSGSFFGSPESCPTYYSCPPSLFTLATLSPEPGNHNGEDSMYD